jgi:hypothetical protein
VAVFRTSSWRRFASERAVDQSLAREGDHLGPLVEGDRQLELICHAVAVPSTRKGAEERFLAVTPAHDFDRLLEAMQPGSGGLAFRFSHRTILVYAAACVHLPRAGCQKPRVEPGQHGAALPRYT